MKIGLVIYGGLETISGGYLYDQFLVDYLRGQGDEVTIISLPEKSFIGRLGQNLWARELAGLTALPLDVLLQDELCHASLLQSNRIVRQSGSFPILSIVHHLRSSEPEYSQLWNNIYAFIEQAYLRKVDGFIYNSVTTRQVVEDIVGTGRPAVVAEPGADRLNPKLSDKEINARAQAQGPLRMISLGNIIPRKGLEILLQALLELSTQDWVLTVVGSLEMDPVYAGRMVELAASPGLGTRVRFRGTLVDGHLAEVMRTSQLLVLPSFYEGYGIAFLEAMGFGMPVVAAQVGAATEIITTGVDGYLVPPGDPQALAEVLSTLIQDREALAEMGIAARQRYLIAPRWDDMGSKVRGFLQGLLAGHTRRYSITKGE